MPVPPCPHPVDDSLARQLIDTFAHCFDQSECTRLIGGAEEPLYLPAGDGRGEHRIYFNRDYPASALHEVAHWCIAGRRRRQLVDYGYWYAPDGRSAEQQHQFERAEIRPQAIERLFSEACGLVFRPSIDNLEGDPGDARAFAAKIDEQYRQFHHSPGTLPPRARVFLHRLREMRHIRAA